MQILISNDDGIFALGLAALDGALAKKIAGVQAALEAAYRGSIHTILTSGSMMVLITASIGPLFHNLTIEQIVQTLSIGCLSAILLILLILPGLLALFDKWVVRKN